MKHSTFYKHKGQRQVYTTISHTDYHRFLREDHEGRTYSHPDDAALYFCAGELLLDEPIPYTEKIE